MVHRKFHIVRFEDKIYYLLQRWSGNGRYYYKDGHRFLRLNWGSKKPLSKKSLLLFGTFLGFEGLGSLRAGEIDIRLRRLYRRDGYFINPDYALGNNRKTDLINMLIKNHVRHSNK